MDKATPTPYGHQGEPEVETDTVDEDDDMPQSPEEALLGE